MANMCFSHIWLVFLRGSWLTAPQTSELQNEERNGRIFGYSIWSLLLSA